MHTIESKPSSLLGPIAVSALVAALVVTAAERIRRRNERITQALAGIAEPPVAPTPLGGLKASPEACAKASSEAMAEVVLTSPQALVESSPQV